MGARFCGGVVFSMCGVIWASLAGGCAIGVKHDYVAQPPNLLVSTANQVTVATQDARPSIVSNKHPASYVGRQRGGYGNPWDVKTKGDKPLADVVTETVGKAFEQQGVRVKTVSVSPQSSADQVKQLLRQSGSPRAILITIRDWDSDVYVNVNLDTDFKAEVFDQYGYIIASNEVRDLSERIGSSFWDPVSEGKRRVPEVLRAKLEKLLGDPKIVGALR
jgi:hypothetical protein